MRIGELAERTGVSCDALRLYERQGLIQADRWPNGYRDFSDEAEALVRLIRQAQGLGFSLAEIGGLLRGLSGGLSSDQVAEVLTAKLAEIDGRISALTDLRALLAARLADACPLGLDRPRAPALRRRRTLRG
ncbi:MerR family transcriptional regulator [Ruegeria sp. PrR005]|uniref:MerR family DNA-binding protein n=1 Tax=Ruegeria sp. PrR005 TaxID=2706882 RepID=A0A6B2NVV5_9RHOB|nr:MerR family transcriptional regulator [Ruegeria sp. PrR005]NDW46863.1 MerR family DNA-binding protein [Ruegeria sp. PrR005]